MKTAKKQKQPPKAAETMESIVNATFKSSAEYIRDQIEEVIAGKAAKTKHDPAYRVAKLTQMLSEVAAEKRKADAAANKHLEKLSRTLVVAWLRTLDKEERRSIARELAQMDAGGSILA